MSKLTRWLFHWPAARIIRVACYLGIASLSLMAWSALVPAALPIVIGMSLGQGLGVLAFFCYLAAVFAEMRRKATLADPPKEPPEPAPESEAGVSVEPE